jgi:hypothetical protein
MIQSPADVIRNRLKFILHCLQNNIQWPALKLASDQLHRTLRRLLQKIMAEDGSAGGWSTIESDEVSAPKSSVQSLITDDHLQGVFTSLIEQLGVKDVQFEELISLDPDTIRALR